MHTIKHFLFTLALVNTIVYHGKITMVFWGCTVYQERSDGVGIYRHIYPPTIKPGKLFMETIIIIIIIIRIKFF